ncbi:MAG: hypothetical protein QNJ56_00060 [Gammaproteobacteria bacterium]|nr:hypothetical protein [Gammaproteobacteria bacterium]
MSLINRFLFRISAYLRCRVIRGQNHEPYLERYHLLRLPFGIQVYLHRFVASDPGRALHNHPWHSALSLVLSGQYTETRLGNRQQNYNLHKRLIRAGSLNFIGGSIYHRINLQPGEQAWTLFIHTASQRSWGFLDTRHRQFCYQDHNQVLDTDSNPLWWKTALRPYRDPQMRSALPE